MQALPFETFPKGSFISSPVVCRSSDMKQVNVFGVGNNMNIYQNQSNDGGVTWLNRFYRVDEVGTFY